MFFVLFCFFVFFAMHLEGVKVNHDKSTQRCNLSPPFESQATMRKTSDRARSVGDRSDVLRLRPLLRYGPIRIGRPRRRCLREKPLVSLMWGSRLVNLTGLPPGIPHPLKEKQENYTVDGPLGFSPSFMHCNLPLEWVGLK